MFQGGLSWDFGKMVDDEEDSLMAVDVGEGLCFYGWFVC